MNVHRLLIMKQRQDRLDALKKRSVLTMSVFSVAKENTRKHLFKANCAHLRMARMASKVPGFEDYICDVERFEAWLAQPHIKELNLSDPFEAFSDREFEEYYSDTLRGKGLFEEFFNTVYGYYEDTTGYDMDPCYGGEGYWA
jgi:hypothetical protein